MIGTSDPNSCATTGGVETKWNAACGARRPSRRPVTEPDVQRTDCPPHGGNRSPPINRLGPPASPVPPHRTGSSAPSSARSRPRRPRAGAYTTAQRKPRPKRTASLRPPPARTNAGSGSSSMNRSSNVRSSEGARRPGARSPPSSPRWQPPLVEDHPGPHRQRDPPLAPWHVGQPQVRVIAEGDGTGTVPVACTVVRQVSVLSGSAPRRPDGAETGIVASPPLLAQVEDRLQHRGVAVASARRTRQCGDPAMMPWIGRPLRPGGASGRRAPGTTPRRPPSRTPCVRDGSPMDAGSEYPWWNRARRTREGRGVVPSSSSP